MYTYLALYSNQAVGGFRAVACGYVYYEESADAEDGPARVESYLFAHLPAGQTLHLQVSGGALAEAVPTDVALQIEDAVEGDTDCDGDSDVQDIMAILLSFDGGRQSECYGAGDWDCSGHPSLTDITGSLSRLAGLGAPLEDCVPDYGGPFD
jgi:hypothetical protein